MQMKGNGVADYKAGVKAVKNSNYVFIYYELSNRYLAANDCSIVSTSPFGIICYAYFIIPYSGAQIHSGVPTINPTSHFLLELQYYSY